MPSATLTMPPLLPSTRLVIRCPETGRLKLRGLGCDVTLRPGWSCEVSGRTILLTPPERKVNETPPTANPEQ